MSRPARLQAARQKARDRRIALDVDREARDRRVEDAAAQVFGQLEDRAEAEAAIIAANSAIGAALVGWTVRGSAWRRRRSCWTSRWRRCGGCPARRRMRRQAPSGRVAMPRAGPAEATVALLRAAVTDADTVSRFRSKLRRLDGCELRVVDRCGQRPGSRPLLARTGGPARCRGDCAPVRVGVGVRCRRAARSAGARTPLRQPVVSAARLGARAAVEPCGESPRVGGAPAHDRFAAAGRSRSPWPGRCGTAGAARWCGRIGGFRRGRGGAAERPGAAATMAGGGTGGRVVF